MQIEFFDDPLQQPKSREDVRIKKLGLFIHEDGQRVTFGLELTPFLEKPSIEVTITNGNEEPAGSLSVIETMTPNFSLIIHLRDKEITNPYELTAVIYYATPDSERQNVDRQTVKFNTIEQGEKIYKFE